MKIFEAGCEIETTLSTKTSTPLIWPGLGALLVFLLSLLAYTEFWGVK